MTNLIRTPAFLLIGLLATSPLFANSVALYSNGDAKDAWAIFAATDTRQWVSADCRNQLKEIGVNAQASDWSFLGSKPNNSSWTSCDQLLDLFSEQSGSESNYSLFINGEARDGFFIDTSANSWQWVSEGCRGRLEAAGIETTRTDWSHIGTYQQVANWQTCDPLLEQLTGTNVSITPPPPPPVATEVQDFGKNCLGVNDYFSNSWGGGYLASDAFKSANGPSWVPWGDMSSLPTVALDQNAWPRQMNITREIYFSIGETGHTLDDFNPWVLLPYDQSNSALTAAPRVGGDWHIVNASFVSKWSNSDGKVSGHEFNFAPTSQGNIDLKIRADKLSAGEGKNRWHLVPKEYAERYAQAMIAEDFRYIFDTDKYGLDTRFPLLHKEVKEQMKKFCRIRFMEGNDINKNIHFDGREVNRNTPATPHWQIGDKIPYEWKVWIANHLGINVWHTDPVRAWEAYKTGDKYLENQARYFAKNLNGHLIREYANEIWNTGSDATKWIENNPTPLPFPENNELERFHYAYGLRSYDTAKPWIDVYTAYERRDEDLDLTIGIQTDNTFFVPHRVKGKASTDWSSRVDSVTASFYFANALKRDGFDWSNQWVEGNYPKIVREGYAGVRELHSEGRIVWQENIREIVRLLESIDVTQMKLHLYEGASHLNFFEYQFDDRAVVYNPSNDEQQTVWNHIEQYLNSEDYIADLNAMFTWWRNQPFSGEAMWYALYGLNEPTKPWGLYESSSADANSSVWQGAGEFVRSYSELAN